MKKIFLYFIFLIISAGIFFPLPVICQDYQEIVQQCAQNAGQDAIYLKDFIIQLRGTEPDERPQVFKTALVLRKNVNYRFSICNMENSEGEAVLRLYDEATLLASTFYPETGKEYKSINFFCQKSGIYNILINFKDGKPGEAIGIMSYISK